MKYDAPQLSVLGSFGELTLTNKCGLASDGLTVVMPGLTGSIVPVICTP